METEGVTNELRYMSSLVPVNNKNRRDEGKKEEDPYRETKTKPPGG